MFGDFGAPTGQVPLYSGNDVLDRRRGRRRRMKGFSGDDIMLGQGGFTSSTAAWASTGRSYELATHGVSIDMNRQGVRRRRTAPVRHHPRLLQQTEGASGSALRRLHPGRQRHASCVPFKDELDNVNLITGLAELLPAGPGGLLRRQHPARRRRQRHHQGRRRQRHHRWRRLPACRADQLRGRRRRSSARSSMIRTATPTIRQPRQ